MSNNIFLFQEDIECKSTVMQNQEDKTNLPEKISPMSSDTETEEQKEEKLAVEVSPKLYSWTTKTHSIVWIIS